MEIFKDFGIDPLLLGAQVLNFLLVLFILKKFLYKPVLSILQKRQNEIKEGIAKANDAQQKLEEAIAQEKTILKNANTNAKKIIEDATNESLEIATQIQENAKKQAEVIANQARIRIDKEVKDAEKRLMENVADVSLKLLQKSLESLFTKPQQEEVLKFALKKFKSIN